MRWRRFTVISPPQASEAVSAILQRLFGGLSIVDTPRGPRHDAYIAEVADWASAATMLADALTAIPPELAQPGEIDLRAEWVRDEDWAEAWKQHYSPMRVGQRLVIVPLWMEWPTAQAAIEARPDDLVVRIDPGMAFGTGAHSSTRLCMLGLAERVEPGSEVIDLGCGSGILTIAACKLGAARVLSIDNDPVCISATASNAAHNGVHERCLARIGDGLEGVEGTWDVIAANINADIVISQATHAASLLRPGGAYIISGFTGRSADAVGAGIEAAGFTIRARYDEGEWLCWGAEAPS